MDKDRIEGSGKQMKGKMKETAGKALGDKKLEAEGKIQNAAGGLKDAAKGKHA